MNSPSGVTQELVERLGRAERLVVLTGAGVSSESGITTFRGGDGLWENYRAEDLATWEAFQSDPELVWRWYEYRRQMIADASPNSAHTAIADLENSYDQFMLVTQNVDGLHARAGSTNPVELHGNIWRGRCTKEQLVVDLPDTPLDTLPPLCPSCGAPLRPDIVWFGEPLPLEAYDSSYEAASECDAMLVVGTSALVRPASVLPLVAKHNGGFVVEVNTEYTAISVLIDTTIIGKAGDVLPPFVDALAEVRSQLREHKATADGTVHHER
ncbi:NAD-dependent deacylase [bacterium]|nr:NAD-dependent deacylase [bacterium]